MIGIICAMAEEVDGFLQALPSHSADARGLIHARIGGADAIIASSGLGKVRAAMTASMLRHHFDVSGLVSAGTAGGLDGTEPMQVVVGTQVIQHDYGRSRGLGEIELYRPGVPPLPEYHDANFAFSQDAAHLARFEALTRELGHVRFGRYASGDTFVNDAATRARLVGLGAAAVDMESAAVAQVAEFHGVPWLVAKGISDSASDQSHEDFLHGLLEASRRSAEVVGLLIPALVERVSDHAAANNHGSPEHERE